MDNTSGLNAIRWVIANGEWIRRQNSLVAIVHVLVPIPTNKPYSYVVPEGMELAPGDYVQVPLGPRQLAAIVWDAPNSDQAKGEKPVDPAKLKAVIAKFDCPPMQGVMRRFVEWVAQYTFSPLGMVARMVLRVPAALDPPVPDWGLRYSGVEPTRMTKARNQVLELAHDGLVWTKSGLANAAGVSASVVGGLLEQGVFEPCQLPHQPCVSLPDTGYKRASLEGEQVAVAEMLKASFGKKAKPGDGFKVHLIDGVTGSGKTEVYFEAVAACLDAGKQVLILLPEISLTSSFLERFEARFGVRPAEWHSEISPKQREKVWRQIITGDVRVVAGARSALFLPFDDLGLVIVDEEHDPAYKQEDRVHYHARDMAVVRGHLTDIPVILASATPSLESRVNANLGKYKYHRLSQRYAEASLPSLSTIDMRKHPPGSGRFISPLLIDKIKATLARGEQSLLFLNRRGYAPLTLCRVCGNRIQCPNCSTWLVEHRFRRQLQCHHCGHNEPVPESCPECGTLDHLVACGPGVERLGEEVLDQFPDARTIVLSSDMLGGVSRLRLELDAIAKGEADIVIGTQLVAKGHNFPLMTCVGVIDSDLGLAHGDLRAAERTFQLLSQVTGRAGRSGAESDGFLQTYQPEHPVLRAIVSGDREAFYEREIDARRMASLPPFSRLAGVIVSGVEKPAAQRHAQELRLVAPGISGISVLGPSEAPLALIRGRYRFRLLVHAERTADLQAYLQDWFSKAPKVRGSVKIQVDVDPQSFV